MRRRAERLLFAGAAALYGLWLYQVAIALRGVRMPAPPPPASTRRRFAVLVPAHNEERVIGHLLDSLAAQRYPPERFDLYVSCDACDDRTAVIAREKGAFVLERRARGTSGKTANLGWALDRIGIDRYDAIALFDADNVVDPGFLASMNDFLEAHPDAGAVQGWLDVKNPDDSWVTRVYVLAFAYANRFWQLARENAGLSVNLGGTGQVVRIDELRRHGWAWTSLTDDLELTCHIVLAGGRVRYDPHAISYDEKPVSEPASRAQRSRWLRGHYSALRRFGWPLLRRSVRAADPRALDLALHLVVPGRAATSYATMFGGFAVLALRSALRPDWPRTDPRAPVWLGFGAAAVVQCALVLIVAPSLRRGRLTLRHLPDAGAYLWYGLRWIPSAISLVRAGRDAVWSRTEHHRALGLAQVERERRVR